MCILLVNTVQFIYLLRLLEGRTGKAWKASEINECPFGIWGAFDSNVFSLLMHLTIKAVRKEAQYIWLTEILDSKSTFRVRM
jgi:hypothetical protein